ncbi:ArsR/SmtB family transcription factor [Corynebacterium gottingense]|uniref:ArsR family transcriptional regulator n=1 Tax=Corynebacterium gottingense TaxID=2041036 RepID=A0ABX9ULH8_9CORY|nr:winged helix-turn-helix domain-containing protein [Corynebacterium gottingense]RMD19679.1 ArsR family transcriptional regulator [Corynebacterium gottingense]WJZ12951.1 Helix-turn-helix domain protein [Corynebacterium gottingense]WJZ15276.1 Helix-turn-helix domain protein [Corynebacterium gottingense]
MTSADFSTDARLDALEARVAALEAARSGTPPAPTAVPHGTELPDLPAALRALEGCDDGAVAFGGSVTTDGGTYEYQWARPTEVVTEHAWSDQIERLAALAHPVRAEMLRHLLSGPATPADLVAAEVVTSTGTAYHHLNALQAAGWVAKEAGAYAIRPARVVPLMAIIIAAEAH